MTVQSPGIVKHVNVLKYKHMGVIDIFDIKPVQPFSFDKRMERFNTGIVPWIGLCGVAFKDALCFVT